MSKNHRNLTSQKLLSQFSLIAGLFIIALQLADIAGLTELKFVRDKIPSVTLLVGGMILTYLGIEYHTILRTIQDAIESHQIENLSILYNRLDPNLAEVFGQEVKGQIEAVKTAIVDKRITIHDQDRFAAYYKKLLNLYPDATFYATGLPYKRYFWNPANQKMIEKFIKNGGKFLRIFYLKKGDAENEEVKEILDAQYRMGVKVYVCDLDRAANQLKSGQYYIVETQKRIGWKLSVDSDNRITKITATANQEDLSNYLKVIDELKDLDATEEYEPATQTGLTSKD